MLLFFGFVAVVVDDDGLLGWWTWGGAATMVVRGVRPSAMMAVAGVQVVGSWLLDGKYGSVLAA